MIINSQQDKEWCSINTAALIVPMVIALIMLSYSQKGYAQSVEPMIFELEPIGSKSSQSLRIENPNSGPITLEIVPLKIILDEFGNETHEPAEDDFLIYPPQTIVQADATQLVKVKYIGDPTIENSQAYRISVNQLPVDLKTDSSGVSILTKFLTIANVSPKKSRPELKITNIQADENNRWLVTVENSGNRFGTLSNTSWAVESTTNSSKTKQLSSDEVGSFVIHTLVPPKSKLHLSVPAIDGFSPESTTIEMKKNG